MKIPSLSSKLMLIVLPSTLAWLSACSSSPKPCEEILEVKQQHMECEQLRKTMEKTNYPQQALTAKLRYEEACLNLRYYRDEYDTICKKDGTPIGAPEEDTTRPEDKDL